MSHKRLPLCLLEQQSETDTSWRLSSVSLVTTQSVKGHLVTLTEVGKQDLQSWRAYHLSERIGQSAYMSTEPRRLLMTELVNLPGPFSFGGTDDLLLRIGRSSRPIQAGKKLGLDQQSIRQSILKLHLNRLWVSELHSQIFIHWNKNIAPTVSLDLMENTLANRVENPGERQLCAINPNLSCSVKENKVIRKICCKIYWKTNLDTAGNRTIVTIPLSCLHGEILTDNVHVERFWIH